MPQDKDYEPSETLVYVSGELAHTREQKLDRCFRAAYYHFEEIWLNKPSIDKTLQNTLDAFDEDGGRIVMSEQDIHPPLRKMPIALEIGAPGGERDRALKWMIGLDRRMRLVVSNVDELVDKDAGFSRVETMLSNNVDIHFCESGITMRRGTRIEGKTRRVLRSMSDSVSGSIKVDDDYQHRGGRPPIGFRAADGQLVADRDGDPTFDQVCAVLQQVADGTRSKRKAANKLGCARATITNCLDRPEMYGIQKD